MTAVIQAVGENIRISTHTLTWSVTKLQMQVQTLTQISTHTLTWSVTIFNAKSGSISIISTHTLTWSVTTEFVIANPILGFQLTRSRGA